MRQKYFLIRQKQRSVAHEKLLSGWYCTRSFRSYKAKAIWHHEIKQKPFPCMPLFTPLILILSCLTSLLLLCIFSMIINTTSNSPIAFSCKIFKKQFKIKFQFFIECISGGSYKLNQVKMIPPASIDL